MSHEEVLKELPDLEVDDIKASIKFAQQRVNHPVIAAWIGRIWELRNDRLGRRTAFPAFSSMDKREHSRNSCIFSQVSRFTGCWSVITSYSIHYTKLYDLGSGILERWSSANISRDFSSSPNSGSAARTSSKMRFSSAESSPSKSRWMFSSCFMSVSRCGVIKMRMMETAKERAVITLSWMRGESLV